MGLCAKLSDHALFSHPFIGKSRALAVARYWHLIVFVLFVFVFQPIVWVRIRYNLYHNNGIRNSWRLLCAINCAAHSSFLPYGHCLVVVVMFCCLFVFVFFVCV